MFKLTNHIITLQSRVEGENIIALRRTFSVVSKQRSPEKDILVAARDRCPEKDSFVIAKDFCPENGSLLYTVAVARVATAGIL